MEIVHFETGWKTKDGLAIYARGWEPQGVTLRGVVCLVHGIGEHGGRYGHVAEAFCNEGMVFWAPDMRGHGRSEGIKGHLASSGTIISDIDQYIGTAREKYPNLPVFLMGHSLGGIFVLFYGLTKPQNLAGVISLAPGLRNALQYQPLKVMAAKVLGFLLPAVTISTGLDATAISRNRGEVEDYIKDPLVHGKMSLGFGRVMLEVIRWTMAHAGEFKVPLLLMHGRKDTIAFSSGSEAFAALLDGKCKLVLWDEAYHELHNEPEREAVIRTMTDWVKLQ